MSRTSSEYGFLFLGFDVRQPRTPTANQLWTAERRTSLLLKPDILYPASVDRVVWPSAIQAGFDNQYALASDLETLSDRIDKVRDDDLVDLVIIEISALNGSSLRDDLNQEHVKDHHQNFEGVRASLLGYDIADQYMVSALSNCMLSANERKKLREAWAKEINDDGLLARGEHAIELAGTYNELIPEHAPFFVYRLREVKPSKRTL